LFSTISRLFIQSCAATSFFFGISHSDLGGCCWLLLTCFYPMNEFHLSTFIFQNNKNAQNGCFNNGPHESFYKSLFDLVFQTSTNKNDQSHNTIILNMFITLKYDLPSQLCDFYFMYQVFCCYYEFKKVERCMDLSKLKLTQLPWRHETMDKPMEFECEKIGQWGKWS
jgi:hypothetical protein